MFNVKISLGLLLVTGMTTEATGGCELTELVTDHILSNVDRDKFVTVMNCNSVSHEVRGNH